jgi:hypothetical protein
MVKQHRITNYCNLLKGQEEAWKKEKKEETKAKRSAKREKEWRNAYNGFKAKEAEENETMEIIAVRSSYFAGIYSIMTVSKLGSPYTTTIAYCAVKTFFFDSCLILGGSSLSQILKGR